MGAHFPPVIQLAICAFLLIPLLRLSPPNVFSKEHSYSPNMFYITPLPYQTSTLPSQFKFILKVIQMQALLSFQQITTTLQTSQTVLDPIFSKSDRIHLNQMIPFTLPLILYHITSLTSLSTNVPFEASAPLLSSFLHTARDVYPCLNTYRYVVEHHSRLRESEIALTFAQKAMTDFPLDPSSMVLFGIALLEQEEGPREAKKLFKHIIDAELQQSDPMSSLPFDQALLPRSPQSSTNLAFCTALLEYSSLLLEDKQYKEVVALLAPPTQSGMRKSDTPSTSTRATKHSRRTDQMSFGSFMTPAQQQPPQFPLASPYPTVNTFRSNVTTSFSSRIIPPTPHTISSFNYPSLHGSNKRNSATINPSHILHLRFKLPPIVEFRLLVILGDSFFFLNQLHNAACCYQTSRQLNIDDQETEQKLEVINLMKEGLDMQSALNRVNGDDESDDYQSNEPDRPHEDDQVTLQSDPAHWTINSGTRMAPEMDHAGGGISALESPSETHFASMGGFNDAGRGTYHQMNILGTPMSSPQGSFVNVDRDHRFGASAMVVQDQTIGYIDREDDQDLSTGEKRMRLEDADFSDEDMEVDD
ncbi:hypothetical protein BLNAU_19702 [Blattamonas nauphoetae]|uniref:Uncharacterized protein n=1 Tax=Blattamonas nauphoetae TaxID=2049346 RepID=A0ABQ9X346_9EUKA|nr:hypothetical protein BLNAU_19702 [Blattamonas nauphoetae]